MAMTHLSIRWKNPAISRRAGYGQKGTKFLATPRIGAPANLVRHCIAQILQSRYRLKRYDMTPDNWPLSLVVLLWGSTYGSCRHITARKVFIIHKGRPAGRLGEIRPIAARSLQEE